MTHGCVDVVVHRVPAVDHQTIHEFHGLGTLTSEFARDDHLAALGAALHDEAEDTVASSEGRKQNKFWVTEGTSAKSAQLPDAILHQLQSQASRSCEHSDKRTF